VSGSPAPNGRVLLVALTPESRAALGAPEREITSFPYRVGRESRGIQPTPHGFVRERRNPGSHPSNDLYLVEGGIVGGDTRGGSRSLHDGDVIIVGSSRSPYAFKFRVG